MFVYRASIVPVLSFGEVDLYEVNSPVIGSFWHKVQLWVKDVTGILPIRFVGQGLFGLLPKRMPINVVGSYILFIYNLRPLLHFPM